MHAPIRTVLTAALFAGALGLVACETYKKAPGEEGTAVAKPGTGTAAADDTGGAAKTGGAKAPAGRVAKPGGAAAKPGSAAAGGVSCEKVADNIIVVAMKQPNLGDEQRERMTSMAERQRKVIIQTCTATPWPANFRDCLSKATSGMEIQACRKFEPPPAAPPPGAPTPARRPAPTPAPSHAH